MRCFRWLHLTDLHWGSKKHDELWGSILPQWLRDIDRVQERCGGPWDAVFFTGDLVNRGKEEEFREVTERLADLYEHLRSKRSERPFVAPSDPYFLVVPGNHDLTRPDSDSAVCMMMTELWDRKEKVRKDIWEKNTGSEAWKLIQTAFKNYTDWYNGESLPFKKPSEMTAGLLPGEFSVTLPIGLHRIGVLGLNTAFRQLAEGDFQGKLDAHPSQIVKACGQLHHKWVEEHDVCLLLTHHPTSWLSENGLNAFEGIIAPSGRFAMHLCGHNHIPRMEESKLWGAEEGRRFLCGKSLFGIMPFVDWKGEKEIERSHGYSAECIDFSGDTPKLRIWPRSMVKKGDNVWYFDRDVSFKLETDEGTAPIQLKSHRKPKPSPTAHDCKHSNIITQLVETPEDINSGNGSKGEEIKEVVKQKICRMLDKKKSLSCFRSVLVKMFEVQTAGGDATALAVDKLLALDLIKAVIQLQKAVRDCINAMNDDGKGTSELILTWDDCVTLLGWLVLTGVKDEWAEKMVRAMAEKDSYLDLKVPVETELGLDIAVSRINTVNAKFKLDIDTNVSAPGRIAAEKWGIECGWDLEVKVLTVKKQLYRQLNPLIGEKEIPLLDRQLNDELKQALLGLKEMEEHHYMVVNLPGKECTYMDDKVYRRLVQDLENLDIFYLGEDSETGMAIVAETRLQSQIRQFLGYKRLIRMDK
jgi:hypothetical protein